jgi:hypothetical protein
MMFQTLAAVGVLFPGAGAAKECQPSLPPEMASLLHSSYPSFHVLKLRELNRDDQGIWQRVYHDACPGVVSGNFFGERPAYAVLIVSGKQTNQEARVILLSRTADDKVNQRQLYEERATVNLPVIRAGPPGTYEAVEGGERIDSPSDVILLEHLESAVTALMLVDGKVRALTLSN